MSTIEEDAEAFLYAIVSTWEKRSPNSLIHSWKLKEFKSYEEILQGLELCIQQPRGNIDSFFNWGNCDSFFRRLNSKSPRFTREHFSLLNYERDAEKELHDFLALTLSSAYKANDKDLKKWA